MTALIIGKDHVCPKKFSFCSNQLDSCFWWFLDQTKKRKMQMLQLTCNIAELRLSQTQKCMKQRDDKLVIKRNIDANTDNLEKLLMQ